MNETFVKENRWVLFSGGLGGIVEFVPDRNVSWFARTNAFEVKFFGCNIELLLIMLRARKRQPHR